MLRPRQQKFETTEIEGNKIMKTITRVYDSHLQAEQVLRNLKRAGIPSDDISVVASRHVSDQLKDTDVASSTETGAGVGAAVGGGAGLLAGLGLLAIPGLGPVVAAGWLAATAVGMISGTITGGLIGALVDAGVTEEDAHVYSEAVRRGATMVTVRASDEASARVEAVMDNETPINPEMRRLEYRKSGWTKFDPNAPEYTSTEVERERVRRTG